MAEARVRPMTPEDVPLAAALSSESYLAVDRRMQPRALPEPTGRSTGRTAWWETRTRHLLATDPGGSWVAEVDGEPVGFAVSFRRELTWVLASYAVRGDHQGLGIGRALLAVAQDYGKGCLRGLLTSSADPRAVRRYRASGFDLHPQVSLTGVVDRSAIPPGRHVREGDPGDRDLLDSLDRRTRGAAHGPDHELLLGHHRLLVSDRAAGSGYCYVEAGAPVLLAATDRRTAARLMWEALASAPVDSPVSVRHVTAANQWALDVGLAARLDPWTSGYLAVRRLRPPAPYLHHGSLL
ncbi:hypothetical protein GCM10011519_00860 [Marmoricola endophyticus]|uniref:N-acetyltransferase domain-containing protein n=1 Tax=Marmoricola endophyticus TaxID=2040280 RepID=A0A917B8E6_9ACTN|nr:GNAT family N-acetyltransferase [Marmoricola endophyticus]GGF31304.1 hypothetical protein GCM10011519_00860 [Marmoricola endophyticus]